MPVNAIMTLTIIEMVLRYGPTAVQIIADAMNTGDPTPEQVRALFITKEPEEYFQ